MIKNLCRALLGAFSSSGSSFSGSIHVGTSSMKVRTGGNSVVRVNGKTYSGQRVDIVGGRVLVDGKEQPEVLSGPMVRVTVNGSPESVQTDSGDITVNGTAGTVSTTSGDVKCESVQGGVSTTSGDVSTRSIGGSVSTVSGDISRSLR